MHLLHQIPDHGGEGDSAREHLKVREFTFDHSFWSLDENDGHFASQEKVGVLLFILEADMIVRLMEEERERETV